MLNNINTILSLSFKDREGNKLNTNDILMQYINDDNAFVSFTEEDKLGIKPSYDYKTKTPLGIYCYPIKLAFEYYVKKSKSKYNFIDNIPFASNRKYLTIFKAKDSSKLINSNYTKEDFSIDFNKLKEKYYLDNKDIFDNFNKNIKNEIYLENNNVNYSDIIENNYSSQLYFLTYKLAKKNPIKWNKIFRELGYEAFVDPGYGIIHEGEPCQTVFFSVKNIEIINRFNNRTDEIKDDINNNKELIIKDKRKEYRYSKLYIKSKKLYNNFFDDCIIYVSEDSNIYNSSFGASNIINDGILDNCKFNSCKINSKKYSFIDGYTEASDTKFNKTLFENKTGDIETLSFYKCQFKDCSFKNKKIIITEFNNFVNCFFDEYTNIIIDLNYAIPKFNNCIFNKIDLTKIKDISDLNNLKFGINIILKHNDFYNINIFDFYSIAMLDSNKFKIIAEFLKINFPNILNLF